jgi:hypothetical protein
MLTVVMLLADTPLTCASGFGPYRAAVAAAAAHAVTTQHPVHSPHPLMLLLLAHMHMPLRKVPMVQARMERRVVQQQQHLRLPPASS